jgi:outer membrane autotransporter protein
VQRYVALAKEWHNPQERNVKFGSSITLLKHFIVKGIALSLICMSGVVAADNIVVSNTNNSGAGSLRDAINQANVGSAPQITFNIPSEGAMTLPVPNVLPALLQNMVIDGVATVPADLTIGNGAGTPLFAISPSCTLHLSGHAIGGNFNFQGDIANNGTLLLQSSNTATYSSILSGTGAVTFQPNPGTTLTLGGVNTYTGGTNITSGTLATGINNALPNTGSVNISRTGTLTIGNNEDIEGLTGAGTVNLGNWFLGIISNSNDTFSGVVAGTGILSQRGPGTHTLSGANTATGMLQAFGGTLALSGGTWAGPITVFQNGTLLLTNNSAAPAALGNNVINRGTITNIDTTNPFLIGGTFTQAATGSMNVAITTPAPYRSFAVTGDATFNGGTVNIILPTATVIETTEVYNIMTFNAVAGPVTLPKVQSPSLFLDFTPSIVGDNTLQLNVKRTPYENVNVIPALKGVAGALDSLINIDQDKFDPILAIVDGATSQGKFEDILEELAPTGLNGLYAASIEGIGGADEALLRLDTIRAMGTQGALARTGYTRGYAAGDMLEDQGSYGPMVFGNSTKQESRNGLPGYNAVTAGFGLLGDVPILKYFRVGLGLSYANSAVKQSNNTGSNTTIGSTQGMAYGSATYGPLFLDSVLSVGMNNYHGKKNMPLVGATATSTYTGFQYGAKVKTGFTIPCYQAEVSPTAGVQYMHLNVGQYTEKGAGILNQQVSSTKIGTVRAMLGGRIADRSQEEDFFPEIHAFYIVDVKNPEVLITSRFVAGGGSFVSKSALPPKAGVNVGASLTALVSDDFVISGGYDLEAKKSFRSHSASLKFKFLF